MRKFKFLAPLAAVLALAGCGGGSNHNPSVGAHKFGATAAPSAYSTPYGPSAHAPGWGLPPAGYSGVTPLVSVAGVQTGTMYDTITLSTVPSNPFALAGYTSGSWPTYLSLRSSYPKVPTVSIAINVLHHADCLDVEPGDAVPSQAAAWVKSDIAAGFKKPCIYSSFWEFLNQVRPDLAAAGISRSQVFEWDANYTFVSHLDASFDATQWTDHALGRNLDASVVTLGFLSIAQPPYVPPTPPPALVLCYTHKLLPFVCKEIKAQVANDLKAASQSLAVYNQNGGPVLAQRIAWFSREIKLYPHARRTPARKRALVASRNAWTQRHLGVFLQRYTWFTAQAALVQKAH